MRCLLLHCKKFSYELDHPTILAEYPKDIPPRAEFRDGLVVLIVVEEKDDATCINSAAKEIRKLARKANTQLIIINPFSHLSNTIAPAQQAVQIIDLLLDRLMSTWDGSVEYTSFGWYKSFNIDVYGHENSQVFREF